MEDRYDDGQEQKLADDMSAVNENQCNDNQVNENQCNENQCNDNQDNENQDNENSNDAKENSQPVYTDPNADVVPEPEEEESVQDNCGEAHVEASSSQSDQNQGNQYQSNQYQNDQYQNDQSQSNQYRSNQYQGNRYQNDQYRGGSQNYGYQNNYDYNTGSTPKYTQNYEQGMDTSPMSMGDWLLTILVSMIPCAGLVLYIVWAFGKTGNINRRNFCRANLIIMACVFVLYLILMLVFGVAFFAAL